MYMYTRRLGSFYIIFTLVLFIIVQIATGFNFLGSDVKANGKSPNITHKNVRSDYDIYLGNYQNALFPDEEIIIEAGDYVEAKPSVKVLDNFERNTGKSIETLEEGYVEWNINVKKAGLYNIRVEYYPIKGRGAAIEREIWINGEIPFYGARHLVFSRVWADNGYIKEDNRGNHIRPSQKESPRWRRSYLTDYMGYYNEPYYFYLREGNNVIRLVSVKEPMVIRRIVIHQAEKPQLYSKVEEQYVNKGYTEYKGDPIKIQAENAYIKSDPTLYAISDRASPATEPYHPSKIRLNTIGGYRWNLPGQWITWKFTVPESGLYAIGLKIRQNMVRGSFSNRRLLIDGKVPFKEAEELSFKYKNDWEMYVVNQNQKPYLFYLDEGEHELTLEVTLGGLADILRMAENSLYQLNEAYRKIIMLTTSTPDPYRDYQIKKNLPDVVKTLDEQGDIINDIAQKLLDYTGQRGSRTAILYRLSQQLKDMAKNPESIPKKLGDFKTNIGGLGTWILNIREQPLEIDYLFICSPQQNMPKTSTTVLSKIVHEIRSLVASFTEDYSSVGNVYKGETLKVWVQTGRDQAQILKQMIDDTFVPETDIPVNVQLVLPQTLLPAVVAGIGPDVALQVGMGDPVNFAMRKAVYDLTYFKDFKDVSTRFHPSSLVPYSFNNGVFALPETQSFPMLFYRVDVLNELGLKIPQTWDEVFDILPVIQKNHMEFGIPVSTNNAPGSGMSSFCMLLYQRGGRLYKENGTASALDEEAAIEAFRQWTGLYVNYKFPLHYDFGNRFRIGEMPIGIADYQMYNFLSVFAPEIRGMWDFAPVPGIKNPDGTVDRSVASGGTGCMILSAAKDKDAAWEFIKWWTRADTQERFGREMESLLGSAARFPTANMEALEKLPWPYKDYKNLKQQWEWVKGNPEVPGGYFTPRHLDNAFRKVIFGGEDTRETLLDYVRVINEEITAKRKEFGLDIID